MDPSLSFHKHCNYVLDRIDKRNMLKAMAGSSWGQDKETLLLTYNALGKSTVSYVASVWSTNASDSSFKKIQTAQNAALTPTGAHKMASIDHLHQDSLTLKVKDHSYMLSAQYLVLFFLDSSQAGRKAIRIYTHAVDLAIQLQGNNREGAS